MSPTSDGSFSAHSAPISKILTAIDTYDARLYAHMMGRPIGAQLIEQQHAQSMSRAFCSSNGRMNFLVGL